MPYTPDADEKRRLLAFEITSADLELAGTLSGFAENRLPKLLEELHGVFAAWPEIQRVLMQPAVHAIRVSHWSRVVSGQLGKGFQDSAQALASTFYDNHVPGYAVAICHSSVLSAVVKDLGLDEEQASRRLLPWRSAPSPAKLRATLTKLAWLDLEMLLETYAKAEQKSRAMALQGMAETIEQEAGAAVEHVSGLTADLLATARAMSSTAAQTGANATEASAAADQTLGTAELVAGSAEQLTSSVIEITHQVTRSRAVAEAAVNAGREAQASIEALSQQANDIGQVAKMIADIAARTNLLALNATIEAARAGEAGKGFAVVAGEVKQLATQTAQSTQEISRQINAVQQATSQAAAAVKSIASTIGEMEHISTSVAAAIEQQSAATAEIARSMAETATAAKLMSAQTGNVQTAAREADLQASAVQETSGVLEAAVRGLRQTVIRVVRTSTSDVDRRAFERTSYNLAAKVSLNGRPAFGVQVLDLAPGGARLGVEEPISVGVEGLLQLEGLQLPFTVKRQSDADGVGVAFALNREQERRLGALLQRQTLSLSA